jgi:hypothetical protein
LQNFLDGPSFFLTDEIFGFLPLHLIDVMHQVIDYLEFKDGCVNRHSPVAFIYFSDGRKYLFSDRHVGGRIINRTLKRLRTKVDERFIKQNDNHVSLGRQRFMQRAK